MPASAAMSALSHPCHRALEVRSVYSDTCYGYSLSLARHGLPRAARKLSVSIARQRTAGAWGQGSKNPEP